jgi:hypothetical protein
MDFRRARNPEPVQPVTVTCATRNPPNPRERLGSSKHFSATFPAKSEAFFVDLLRKILKV